MAQSGDTGRTQASHQRRSPSALAAGLVGFLLSAAWASQAVAEESKYAKARRQHPVLFKLYYDEIVTAYCGLLTPESEAGFRLEREALLADDPLSEEAHREVRVASDIAADYAYQDHGLSGQKHWCGTEGRDAYNRFVIRYRAQLPAPGTQTEQTE